MTVQRTQADSDSATDVTTDTNALSKRWSRWNIGRIRIFGVYVHFAYFLLLLAELSVITAAFYFSYTQVAKFTLIPGWVLAKSLLGAGPISLCFAGLGLYSSRHTLSGTGILLRYLVATAVALPILATMHFLLHATLTTADFILPLLVAILLLAGLRTAFGNLLDSDTLKRRVLLVGSGESASYIQDIADQNNQRGFTLTRFQQSQTVSGDLVRFARRHQINEVVVAYDDRRNALPAKELLDCRLSGISVVDVLDFLERETGIIPLRYLQPSWLIFTDGFVCNIYSRIAKRVMDVVAAGVLLIFTLPIILLTCLVIKLDRGAPGPILYRQIRVGQNGKHFHVLKFRSMRADAESNGKAQWASQNDPRVSRVGAILRKYRIDELPQLFNVLSGSMSMVGPRPERPVFVEALSARSELYTERHRVKSGVTGWAQLRFPYTDDEAGSIEKLQYDMYYLKNRGTFFDFYILLQTIEVVLFGKGAR